MFFNRTIGLKLIGFIFFIEINPFYIKNSTNKMVYI